MALRERRLAPARACARRANVPARAAAVNEFGTQFHYLERSVALDPGRLDDLAPLLGFGFDELRELERRGERFDTIVLDPPAFAKNKAAVPKALSGYKEINLRALKLLAPGGFLITCSCSYNVSEGAFADVIASAAVDAHADVAVVEKRMQGRDHPVLLTVPETFYLKCFILRKLG